MENNININKPLLEIVYQISSSLNFQVILNKIIEERTLKYLSTKRAAIYLLDKDKEFLEPVATFDPSDESQVMSEKINVISSLSGKVVKAKKGMIFNNASKIPNAYQIPGTPDDEDEHLMVLPLLFETEILGTLNLYRRSILYSQEDLEFATIFAMYAGVAIQNAQKHQSLVREIEERKQAEEKLKDSEEKYRTLFDNMSNGFALHKIVLNENKVPIDYTFIEVNDAFENLTGLVRKNIIGNNVTEILSGIEKDTIDWIGIYGKVALTQKSIQFENFAGPLNKWYSVNVYSPKKGYFATIFEDITEKKQNEEELLASVKDSQRFRKALDMVPAFVYLKDTQSRYLYANQSTLELFGVSQQKSL